MAIKKLIKFHKIIIKIKCLNAETKITLQRLRKMGKKSRVIRVPEEALWERTTPMSSLHQLQTPQELRLRSLDIPRKCINRQWSCKKE